MMADTDTIVVLRSKAATLAATLERSEQETARLHGLLSKAETDSKRAVTIAYGRLDDCASLLDSYALWHGALFKAIERITEAGPDPTIGNPMDESDRMTVRELASIGRHLAENAWSNASEHRETVKAERGAA